ncbi:arylesterase [Acrasis kona]|uniref:Arylesterase n=1 Tax=Acrasis kona TaxID=1008807 RepID=A0AAW2ZGU6_9EUKA
MNYRDSLTKGYYQHGTEYHPYTSFIEEKLTGEFKDHSVYTTGVNGETTTRMLNRLPKELEVSNFKVAIILCGTNDIGVVEADAIFENIKALHQIALQKVKYTVALTIPCAVMDKKPSVFLNRKTKVNQMIRDFAQQNDRVELVDIFSELHINNHNEKDIWDDNLHFTPEGYRRIGEAVWNELQHVLKKLK